MLEDPTDRARRLLEVVSADERSHQRPLPGVLAERLRAIPSHEISCEVVERLYRQSLRGALAATAGFSDGQPDDTAAERHLASCPRCHQLYQPLQAIADERRRRAIPTWLAERLRAIPRRQRPSPWIRDSRYAAAVCYLLTAGLMLAGGSLQAQQLIDATRHAGQSTSRWLSDSQQTSSGLAEQADERLSSALAEGQRWLATGGEAWRSFVETTEEQLRRLPELLDIDPSSNQGDPDGTSDTPPL